MNNDKQACKLAPVVPSDQDEISGDVSVDQDVRARDDEARWQRIIEAARKAPPPARESRQDARDNGSGADQLDGSQLKLRLYQADYLLASWRMLRSAELERFSRTEAPPLDGKSGPEVVGSICHAVAALIQKLIWDATPMRGPRSGSFARSSFARLKGFSQAPYIEVVPLEGSWLRAQAPRRDDAVRVLEPEILSFVVAACDCSIEQAQWCWRALVNCLQDAGAVLPDLRTETRDEAIEIFLQHEIQR